MDYTKQFRFTLTIEQLGDVMMAVDCIRSEYAEKGKRKGFENCLKTAKRFSDIGEALFEQRKAIYKDLKSSYVEPELVVQDA